MAILCIVKLQHSAEDWLPVPEHWSLLP